MGWITLVVEAIKLVMLILGEVWAAKKRARLAQETYEIDQTEFRALALKVLKRMREEAKDDSAAAKKIEDEVDEELKKNQ